MQRIQCKRTKGWRKPPGAVYVGRGPNSKWGNPYPVSTYGCEQAVALYRQDVEQMPAAAREAWLAPLRNATALMCWCKPDEVCHADVLIEYLTRATTPADSS
jgi:Domain of unknown function (DUF4326)